MENRADGSVELREYDGLGRLERLAHLKADGSVRFEAVYHLADDGTRAGITETRSSGVVDWDYEYDELGRLTRETCAAYSRDISYTYDADSNRASETDENTGLTKTYVYFPGTQQLDQILFSTGGQESFTWTVDCELDTHTDTDGKVTDYDWTNCSLTRVTFDNGSMIGPTAR